MTMQLDVVRGIGMMGSDEMLQKLLKTVEVSLTCSISEIRQALEAGDASAVNRLLHGIKGYAPIFCSDALIEKVQHVEGISKTATVAVMIPLFTELAPQLEALLLEIQSYGAQG
jgi:HPt (histidine-containing phosphotransfer) domain-containing protein